MPLALAELWTARLVALALLLQTVELLQIARVWRDDGVWSFRLLAPEHRVLPAPLRWLFAALLPERAFTLMLGLRAALCLLLLLGNSAACVALFVTQIAICVRFRGTFNGGSDSMSVLSLLTLCVAWAAEKSPLVVAAAFVYLAVQTTFSYVVAGVAKLQEPAWRNGSALSTLVGDRRYGVPAWVLCLIERKGVSRTLSTVALTFECSFPLALTGATAGKVFVAMGLVFHLTNSVVFGLNRFLFAWAAAYPALLFTSAL